MHQHLIESKFYQLNPDDQQMVMRLCDFLLYRSHEEAVPSSKNALNPIQQALLDMPEWTEDELETMELTSQKLASWQIETW